MAKPNAFVKVSGNLIEKEEVLEWLKELGKEYYVAVCIGGGKQINEAFSEKGFEVRFGPMGRITETLEEKQLARDVLEINQAIIQDRIDERGINARVITPVDEVATVLCHINGDIFFLYVYNGFDKLFLLTQKDNVEKKEQWLKQVAAIFSVIEERKLDKAEVVGF